MPFTIWQAWDDRDGGVVFAPASRCVELMRQGLLPENALLLYDITARTGEEAMTLHYERMGFEPYEPTGEPRLCPNACGGSYYPEGYGECPNCGLIA